MREIDHFWPNLNEYQSISLENVKVKKQIIAMMKYVLLLVAIATLATMINTKSVRLALNQESDDDLFFDFR